MDIRIVFAALMSAGIAFLCRVLVAFLKETALARRNAVPRVVEIEAPSMPKAGKPKLARLKPVDAYVIRGIPTL